MSKINVLVIVLAHFKTIVSGGFWQSFRDLIVFVGIPLAAAVFFGFYVVSLADSLRQLFVTIFSVFSALLFSAQIGLFALRRVDPYSDLSSIEAGALRERDESFNQFLREFSANTSYLILLSAAELMMFSLEYFVDALEGGGMGSRLIDALIIFLAAHFFLTLLMALKRFFVAYEASY